MQDYKTCFKKKKKDAVRAAILKGISNGVFTFDDLIVYDETGVPPREDADGGRIGLPTRKGHGTTKRNACSNAHGPRTKLHKIVRYKI